jgi:ABC-type glycerol-3-phosphate transport system permease component
MNRSASARPLAGADKLSSLPRFNLRRVTGQALIYLALLLLVSLFTFPLLWMISTSLKTPSEVYRYPPTLLPDQIVWENYVEIFKRFPIPSRTWNTIEIVILVEIGTLLSSSVVAYSFARLRAPGKELLFLIMLGTMMIPYPVVLVPQYILFNRFHWIDTIYPLVIPAFFGAPFNIFLLRQFLSTIPKELDDAARIDGCGHAGIYWRIVMPLAKPALTTIAIFTFMFTWGDYFSPSIYLNSFDKTTLAVSIRLWAHGGAAASPGKEYPFSWIMAMALLLTLPPLLIFFFLQRRFIQGVVFTGVKG